MPDHAYLPPQTGSAVPHVGTYRRVLPVNLDRMFENALDWEHLPHLHSSSFGGLELIEAGSWGWRARVQNPDGSWSDLELRLDQRQRRWVTRNLDGPNEGAEIWTYVIEREADEIEIFVDFFVPGVPEPAREKVGQAYARAYERLYDEDVRMMVDRQRALDRRVEGVNRSAEPLLLGDIDGMDLPLQVDFAGRTLIVDRQQSHWVIYPAFCPHMQAPLAGVPIVQGTLTCPWHGYQFDVHTGACVSGQACELRASAAVVERDGALYLESA